MVNTLLIVDYILSIAFIIWFPCMFYLSLKKCFWKEGTSKVALFLLSFVASPYLAYGESVLLLLFLVQLFPGLTSRLEDEDFISIGVMIVIAAAAAAIYMLLIGLYVFLIQKITRAEHKEPVLFLYLMFTTIGIISNRSSGSGEMFNVPYMREIVDIIGVLFLILAVWIFYRLDVLALAKMTHVRVKVSWKVFTIPPAVFAVIFSVLEALLQSDNEIIDEKTVLLLYAFSTIIVFLFIWAFHAIIKNINATDEAVRAKDEVKALSVEVMEALAHTIDAKDEYTRGHSIRVAKYSRMLAEKLGLSPEKCENVYYMGLLHDIGKIGVPNAIINSPRKLTEEEYEVIKSHPVLGYDILAEIKSRPDLAIGAKWHHERYDGRGYPDGKAETDIPFLARIISVADSYDAMTSTRSYRKSLPQDVVRSEIEKNIGTQFDPEVARCMLTIIDADAAYTLHE